MEVQLSENQANVIRQIAEKEGFVDFELKATPGSVKGDNYMGIITTVSVKNHRKKLELILKSASDNEKLRKVAPIRVVFVREIYLYNTVFPEFEKFEKEENLLDGFSGHPKLYACCDEEPSEFLIFENLKEAGYQLWNRTVPMNGDHVQLVFKEYGKFHALSLALKEKRPELYDKLTRDLGNVFDDMTKSPEEREGMIKTVFGDGLKAVKGDQLATEALERFSLVAYKFFSEDMRIIDEHSVILHGDCWCNNMLFKYEDPQTKKPSKVSLIDWQVSWVSSPVLDLSYFLFTCAPKEILVDHKKYLKIYHDSLSNTLRNLHCDAETLFPFSALESHWQKFAKFGIYISLMLVKIMVSDGNETPVVAEMAESGKNFAEVFSFETIHNDAYNRRILDIITVADQNNWI